MGGRSVGGIFDRSWDVTAHPFDAKGDGVHDDWRAIQQAVDSAGLAGGGTVWLPGGTYLLSATIAIHYDSIHIHGAGPGRTVLVIGPKQNTAAILAAGPAPDSAVRGIHASDLTIEGQGSLNDQHYIGIFFQRVHGGSVERVESRHSTDIGLGFGDASIPGPTTRDILVLGCWAHDNTGNGFDAANVTRIAFIANRAERNGIPFVHTGVGFFTGHGSTSDVLYFGNTAVDNAGAGFQASSGRNDAEDQFTGRIRYIANVVRGTRPSPIAPGSAFVLNRGGPGPTRMPGPFEFFANVAETNTQDAIVTGGRIARIVRLHNRFGPAAQTN